MQPSKYSSLFWNDYIKRQIRSIGFAPGTKPIRRTVVYIPPRYPCSPLQLCSRLRLQARKLLVKVEALRISNRGTNLNLLSANDFLHSYLYLLPIDCDWDLRNLDNKLGNMTWRQSRTDGRPKTLYEIGREWATAAHLDEKKYDLICVMLATSSDAERILDFRVECRSF